MLIHPALGVFVVILLVVALFLAFVLLVGDGRRSVEGDRQEVPPPADFYEWL